MKSYVLGFVFNLELDEVVLIRKQRPLWQKGKLNGIGGSIEPGEASLEAMRREFKEETNVFIHDWKLITELKGKDWRVVVFTTKEDISSIDFESVTDEVVTVFGVDYLLETSGGQYMQNMIGNIPWLVSMARCMLIPNMDQCSFYAIEEKEALT